VSLTVQIGVLLALACAFTSIVGFLMKHRGAVESPPIEVRRPVRTSLALFRSRWYTIGIVVATASWGFHVAALSLAPISLVQSVIAGGLVLLTVAADRLFGHDVARREWIGVALIAVGLAFLAATLGETGEGRHSDYAGAALGLYVGALAALGFAAAPG
jgi:multidrug transporter EmrE-like cation transporter